MALESHSGTGYTPLVNLETRQAVIYARLQRDDVRFFDAATHPLGAPSLRAGV